MMKSTIERPLRLFWAASAAVIRTRLSPCLPLCFFYSKMLLSCPCSPLGRLK